MRASRRRAQAGFSLIEILVALLLSAIILLSVVFVFITNTEQYYGQEQVVQMQERMRFALEYLKEDVRNAGRLAIANGNVLFGTRQVQGLIPVQAVQLFENEAPPGNLGLNGNGLRPDRLRLLVDASGGVPLGVLNVTGDQIKVAPWLLQRGVAARRQVEDGARDRFESLYTAGSYAYLEHPPTGRFSMVPIRAATFQNDGPLIELGQNPLMMADCAAGECVVNPVQLIEYRVDVEPERLERTHLYRRQIDVSNNLPIEPAVLIAEYVVNLQFWGLYDRGFGGVPDIPPDLTPGDDIGNWPAASESDRMNQSPHRLRAMHVMLAVRTAREDRDFRVAPDRDIPENLRVAADRTWFELEPDLDGLARVTTLVSKVETPNLNRGM